MKPFIKILAKIDILAGLKKQWLTYAPASILRNICFYQINVTDYILRSQSDTSGFILLCDPFTKDQIKIFKKIMNFIASQ